MDLRTLTGSFAFIKAENRLLKFAILLIAASNVILGIFCWSAVKTKQVVVVPLTSSRVIVGKTPDRMYLLAVSRFVFDNLLTFTPYTVEKQYSLVLELFSPEVYSQYKKIFTDFVKTAKTAKLASVFLPEKEEINTEEHTVRVTGRKLTLLEDTVVEKNRVTYELRFQCRYGTFRISSFKRVKGEKES